MGDVLDLKALLSKILDALKVDYIVEEGTATPDSYGVWGYRKWNSGIAECWRTTQTASFAPTTAVGGFYGRVLSGYSFPTGLFITTPQAFVDVWYWGTGWFWGQARNTTTSTYNIAVWKNVNAADSFYASIYAIGTWKTFTGGVINTLKQFLINIFTLERGWVCC